MILLTASNADFQEIGDLNEECLKRYCALHPQHSYVRWLIPRGYAMPASWFKLSMLLYHLELDNPHVMWIDADALLIGDQDIPITEHCDLQICQDINDINCGVMVWRHSNLVMDFLQRINAMTEYFTHPWWEQKAIMDYLGELTVGYMDKATWNAYPVPVPNADAGPNSQIVHFPAVKKRLEVMQSYAQFPDLLAKQDSVNTKWLEMGPGGDVKIIFHPDVLRNESQETITSKSTDKIDSTDLPEAVDASDPVSAITTLPEPYDAPQAPPDGKETNLKGESPS